MDKMEPCAKWQHRRPKYVLFWACHRAKTMVHESITKIRSGAQHWKHGSWMMSILPELAQLTFQATETNWDRSRWEQLPDDGNRYEVIDGVLYMTTAPSAFHQWIVQEVYALLRQTINQTGVGVTFIAPIGVFMPHCDPAQPDVVVVRREDIGIIHDRHIYGVPALIVEVVSPSNARQDTETKRRAYARAGVPEYWVVRPTSRDLVLYTQPDEDLEDYGHSAIIAPEAELISPTLPIRAWVADFFAGAPDTTI